METKEEILNESYCVTGNVFRYNTRSMEEFDGFVHAILNSTLRITKNEVLYGYWYRSRVKESFA